MSLLQAIKQHAGQSPLSIALIGDAKVMTYAELHNEIPLGAKYLLDAGISSVALLADNGIPWVLGDLATRYAQTPCVPLPHFFSSSQTIHAIHDSGVDGLLTDRPDDAGLFLSHAGIKFQAIGKWQGLHLLRLIDVPAKALPDATSKITYTSGTTGHAKGVCLSAEHIDAVSAALLDVTAATAMDRHLCLTPLSTLLENLGGVYVPLMAGASCCVPSLRSVGLSGAAGLDAIRMIQALHEFQASTAILVPQMLHALIAALNAGIPKPAHLRFLAVGGAPVPKLLLELAAELALPVYQGYGLSECASVVALNTSKTHRPGSVGRPLPHAAISIASDGEILVDGPLFLGYLGQKAAHRPWATGDIGHMDADGYLYITGRKKDIFITSLGRNVSPEWVEGALIMHPNIAQAAVFGEGQPWNCAVVVPRGEVSLGQVKAAIEQVNLTLPDYARIGEWLLADVPFTPANGQLTANGRLRRSAIFAAYQHRIESLYQEEIHVVL